MTAGKFGWVFQLLPNTPWFGSSREIALSFGFQQTTPHGVKSPESFEAKK
jgi:hypothetical protein